MPNNGWKMRQLLLLAATLALACKPDPAPRATSSDSVPSWRQPGDKVDSVFAMSEYERRFRVGLTEVTALDGGARSRDELVRRFFMTVASRDTTALDGLFVDAAEFSWLVYPQHRYREPPYELDPAIFWLQLDASTAKGTGRLFDRYGGSSLEVRSVACEHDSVVRRGTTTLWAPCTVTITRDGATEAGRYFGSIVERDGVFKLLSGTNDM